MGQVPYFTERIIVRNFTLARLRRIRHNMMESPFRSTYNITTGAEAAVNRELNIRDHGTIFYKR